MNPELEAVLKNYLSPEAIAQVRADLEAHRVPGTLSAAIVRLEESILRARARGLKKMMLDVDDVELLIREATYVDSLEAVVDRAHPRESGMSDLREMHASANPCGTGWPHAMHIHEGEYCPGRWKTNGLNSTKPTVQNHPNRSQ